MRKAYFLLIGSLVFQACTTDPPEAERLPDGPAAATAPAGKRAGTAAGNATTKSPADDSAAPGLVDAAETTERYDRQSGIASKPSSTISDGAEPVANPSTDVVTSARVATESGEVASSPSGVKRRLPRSTAGKRAEGYSKAKPRSSAKRDRSPGGVTQPAVALHGAKPTTGAEGASGPFTSKEKASNLEGITAGRIATLSPPKLTEAVLQAGVASEIEAALSALPLRRVFFNTVDARTGKPVDIDVEVIDLTSQRSEVWLNSQQATVLPLDSGHVDKRFVFRSRKYRDIAFDVNLQRPVADGSEQRVGVMGDTLIVTQELERLRGKNDVAVTYDIFFHPDATVMRQESRYEANALLRIMKDNPDVKIRIHGHTNGSGRGKILGVPEADTNFFRPTRQQLAARGSAKALAAARAATIKRFLTHYGVEPHRVAVKGWGGRRPLVEAHAKDAHKNLRVEIEFTDGELPNRYQTPTQMAATATD